jgi:hypothetical protein
MSRAYNPLQLEEFPRWNLEPQGNAEARLFCRRVATPATEPDGRSGQKRKSDQEPILAEKIRTPGPQRAAGRPERTGSDAGSPA